MKRQNDWYTGIDHYSNYMERDIQVEYMKISRPTKQSLHERVEMYYVLSGEGEIMVNGCPCEAKEGSLFCLYSHNFYYISKIKKCLEMVCVRFHIGLFMYMSWEKHPGNANAKLVYDTKPVVRLKGSEKERIENLIHDLMEEQNSDRFERKNMIEYKTLELHAYFCRYAFEQIGTENPAGGEGDMCMAEGRGAGDMCMAEGKGAGGMCMTEGRRGGGISAADGSENIWDVILKIVLAASSTPTLTEAASECGCSPVTLNRRIKAVCGHTFHQLVQFGKVINACALLHFPELSMEYISDLLEFPSVQGFYRVFAQYCKMTPRQYQKTQVGDDGFAAGSESVALQFLQYIYMYFYDDITEADLARKFCLKPYTVQTVIRKSFGRSFEELLGQIRISYACGFLSSTDKSVLEISTLCGFSSSSTFLRYFKYHMNQTPGQYRKSMSVLERV